MSKSHEHCIEWSRTTINVPSSKTCTQIKVNNSSNSSNSLSVSKSSGQMEGGAAGGEASVLPIERAFRTSDFVH